MKSTDIETIYNRIGRFQDTQTFYEAKPVDDLVEHLDLSAVSHLVEIGCGTGRLAGRLLQSRLPEDATYVGVDISDKMVDLATKRLQPFGARARVIKGDINAGLLGTADRIIAVYVMDLMTHEQVAQTLQTCRSILSEDGLVGFVSLTKIHSGLAGWISNTWSWIHERRPSLVGGCRPIDLRGLLESNGYEVVHRSILTPWGIASEVCTARPGTNPAKTPQQDKGRK